MTLSDYMEAKGITASALAKSLNVSVSTVSRVAKGEIIPSKQLMVAIYRYTEGAVTPNDHYDLEGASDNPKPGAEEITA